MSYEQVIRGLSEGTARVIGQVWSAVEAGRLARADFPAVAADLIAVARIRGAAAAETAFRGYLEAAYGIPIPAATSTLAGDRARLAIAVDTILANDALDTAMQLARLAANEPLDAAASAYGDVMGRSSVVSGWRRGLDSDPCQLCRWWAREGRVFHKNHALARHPGCACHQIPVVDETTDNYQTATQAAGALRTRQRRNP